MLRNLLLCSVTFFYAQAIFAGTEIANSRVVYDDRAGEATLAIRNPDDRPYLIHAWIAKEAGNKLPDETFAVELPLFRLEPHSQSMIRIHHSGDPLPQDRESVFWLNIESYPSTAKNDKSDSLLVVVKSKLKLFYRPKKLFGDAGLAYQKLKFSLKGNKLFVYNPTVFSVSFYAVEVNGKVLPHPFMVLPGKELCLGDIATPNPIIRWRSINDYGGVSEAKEVRVE